MSDPVGKRCRRIKPKSASDLDHGQTMLVQELVSGFLRLEQAQEGIRRSRLFAARLAAIFVTAAASTLVWIIFNEMREK